MRTSPDVVVVGAGAVGCAVAFHLADAGARVVLVEREAIASGASTHATGFLSLAATDFQSEPYFLLGLEGFRATRALVPRLLELTGIDLLYQLRPGLRLALDEEEERFIRDHLAWQERHIAVRWIDGDEVRAIEPRLSPAVRGAAYEAEAAQLDSARYTLALATAAERCGAALLLRRVLGLVREGDHATAVEHQSGRLACGAVVLALGPWAPVAAPWLGMPIPVRPLKGERLQLQLDGPPLPALVSSPKRGSLISRRDGFLSVGSTAGRVLEDTEPYLLGEVVADHLDVRPTEAARDELLGRALEVIPAAAEARLVLHLAGVRPLSPDRWPLVGRAPAWQNVYLATGHGHRGIHLAAVTGQIVADLVLRGTTDVPVALDRLAAGRFLHQPVHFTAAPHLADD